MSQYDADGRKVTIQPVDRSFFFYRVQGISISVSTRTSLINCTIGLIGLAGSIGATASCRNCDSLDTLGPGYWGINVPRAYSKVEFNCSLEIDGKNYNFNGQFIFGSGNIPD